VSAAAVYPAPVFPGPARYYPAIPGPLIPFMEACRGKGTRAKYYDPAGMRYGMPTYPWRWAPPGWLTRRQLRAVGLRPGGQQPCGQVLWDHRGKRRHGYLYLRSLALPVRPMTRAMWAAHCAAMNARMTCPKCQTWRAYCIPTSVGHCNECASGGAR
jgi:hypothetical protein